MCQNSVAIMCLEIFQASFSFLIMNASTTMRSEGQ